MFATLVAVVLVVVDIGFGVQSFGSCSTALTYHPAVPRRPPWARLLHWPCPVGASTSVCGCAQARRGRLVPLGGRLSLGARE